MSKLGLVIKYSAEKNTPSCKDRRKSERNTTNSEKSMMCPLKEVSVEAKYAPFLLFSLFTEVTLDESEEVESIH